MRLTGLRHECEADGRQQEGSGAQPEGQVVVVQHIVEPACRERPQSRTQSHRDALHGGDRAVGPRPKWSAITEARMGEKAP